MSVRDYFLGPVYEIQAYRSEPPQDALAFIGSPRKHPYDDEKIILLSEPKEGVSSIFEFKASDIVGAKDLPSPVTVDGESYRIVRLWIRRGSIGMCYEPFEVDTPLRFLHEPTIIKDKIFGRHRGS